MAENEKEKSGPVKYIITGLAISYTLFHLYTGYFGMGEAYIQRIIHFGGGSLLVFLIIPMRKGKGKRASWVIDILWIIAIVISMGYLLKN